MAQPSHGEQHGLIVRTADGLWYRIEKDQLAKLRMSDQDIAQLREELRQSTDTKGFGTGAGTNTGYMYTWKGMYYKVIGVDPSFANL
jgi:hypothetical protein